MKKTSIAWTGVTWNPVTGCTQCSPECKLCYAKTMAIRLQAMGQSKYRNGFKVTTHPKVLDEPLSYVKKNVMCFVCSMSDLFHVDVPFEFIDEVFKRIIARPDITFQVLTKRSERMAEYFSTRTVPANCWIGVTCGCKSSIYRLNDLRKIEAPIRWVSAEPLVEDIAASIDLSGIDWVVVGGESGAGARKMEEQWTWDIKEKCDATGVAFFFKQWRTIGSDGVRRKKDANGCSLKGAVYQAYPQVSKVKLNTTINN